MSEAGRGGAIGRLFGSNEFKLALTIAFVVVLTAIVDQNHTYWRYPQQSAEQIFRNAVLLGIVALGSALVIISGGIDLSVGSMIAFSGSICAIIMLVMDPEGIAKSDFKPHVVATAVGGTIATALLVGSLHAWLITVVRLPPFIATLATLVGLRSLARILVEEVNATFGPGPSPQINIADPDFRKYGAEVEYPTIIFLILAVAAWFLLHRTVLGRHLTAMGGNEQAARLSGIPTDRLKWFAYCASAVLASVAGILYIGNESMADPQTQGVLVELNAIAAAVVGGCRLQGGVGTISGVVLGCFFLRTVTDAVAKLIKGSANLYEGIVVGIVVVVAVAFSQARSAGQQHKQFFPGTLGWIAVVILAMLAAALGAAFGGRWVSAGAGGAILVLTLGVKLFEQWSARRAAGVRPDRGEHA